MKFTNINILPKSDCTIPGNNFFFFKQKGAYALFVGRFAGATKWCQFDCGSFLWECRYKTKGVVLQLKIASYLTVSWLCNDNVNI